ncbi:hypothetical protein NUU61_008156 [Penicillium alfredii]|uniref:Ubiquinone biosynthesis protein n=1 Tax=Penicillium alfredii TaxID=1506179 RepID=A0A9W9JYQ9_9EURO|nr:uncharacterized protein NUU61_008156 [Penicillium alfredii]KAJ5086849.1 hypothetical protein NUU61_008156 [Penicillium alfredii]
MAHLAHLRPLSRRAIAHLGSSANIIHRNAFLAGPSALLSSASSAPTSPSSPLPAIRATTTKTPSNNFRAYHSTLHPHPQPTHEYTNSQTAILSAALAHIPTHGFSAAALTLGARDAGFLDVSVQLLPRAEFDLVLFWLASRRGLLRAKVEEGGLFARIAAERGPEGKGLGLSVEEKVKVLVLERLGLNVDVKDQWQDALAQMSLLGNIPLSLAELHALADDILSLAGDASVDTAWYSRRLAVAAIYASAEVVMTRDHTPDLAETAAFVERRFEDRDALTQKLTGLGQFVGFWGNTAVGLGRSWGLKI